MDAEKKLMNEIVQQVVRLRSNIDENEQYKRLDTLVISGTNLPQLMNGESCKDIVREHLQEQARLFIKD